MSKPEFRSEEVRLIGERLKQARESLNLSQRAFGNSLGLPGPESISRWERGQAFPPTEILLQVYEKHGISIEWLLTGKGQMQIKDIREGLVPFWEKPGPTDPMADDLHFRKLLDFIAVQGALEKDVWESLEDFHRQDIRMFLLWFLGRATIDEVKALAKSALAWVQQHNNKS